MRSIVSLFIASIILFSGFNFGVSSHFCGGKYVASAWGISAKNATCGMKDDDLIKKNNTTILRKKCCENKYIELSTDNYTNHSSDFCLGNDLDLIPQIPFDYSASNIILVTTVNNINYKAPPPLSSVDIHSICILRI